MSVVKPPEIHKSTKSLYSSILNNTPQLNIIYLAIAFFGKTMHFFSICRAQVKNGFLNEAINVSYGKQYIPETKRELRQTHVTVSPILRLFSESSLWSLNKILKLNNNSSR